MTAEEIFKEVLDSPELQSIFQISKEDLRFENLDTKSDFDIVEIIRTIISGQENYRGKDAIFQTIQKQIMQL